MTPDRRSRLAEQAAIAQADRDLDRDIAGWLIVLPLMWVAVVWMAIVFDWPGRALLLWQRWGA